MPTSVGCTKRLAAIWPVLRPDAFSPGVHKVASSSACCFPCCLQCCSLSCNMSKKDLFLSSSWDDTIKLWSLNHPSSLRTFPGHTYCVYQTVW